MLMNNLDPDVAERPSELVVYGGIGRAARDWESFDRIAASLRKLEADQTLLVQSGKPVGVFRTHADAPRVLIANSNLVPHWATLDHFNELDRQGLMMFGQMTAGSWIYIGSQGIVQGTYETFVEVGRRHYRRQSCRQMDSHGGPRRHGRRAAAGRDHGRRFDARGRVPAEPDRDAAAHRLPRPPGARRSTRRWRSLPTRPRAKKPVSVGLLGNAAEIFPELVRRGVRPDIVTDQTSAHDPINGYLPKGWTLAEWETRRAADPKAVETASKTSMVDSRPAMLDFHAQGIPTLDYGNNIRQMAKDMGLKQALRFSGLRAGLYPAAVLPRRRAVPLGGAVGRSRGHLQDRCQGQGADAATMAICTTGSTWRRRASSFRGCRRGSAGSVSATAIALGLAFNEMVARGELKAPIVIGRDHLDSGSVASPNRETEAMRDGSDAVSDWPLLNALLELCERRHLGVAAPRRRRRHRLLAACRHGDRRRRHAGGGAPARARAVERPGDRRDAPRRRRL